MSLSREDAEKALAEIGAAETKIGRVHGYADAAPFFILWGAIWAFANLATELRPAWGNWAWLAGIAIGTPLTAWFGITQARRRGARMRQAGENPEAFGLKSGLSMAAILLFLVSVIAVTGPLDGRQGNAVISLFWACVYMGVGAWVGWRLFAIGAAAAAIILFAYFGLDQHYFLAMGLGAGGCLIVGGLLLRRI